MTSASALASLHLNAFQVLLLVVVVLLGIWLRTVVVPRRPNTAPTPTPRRQPVGEPAPLPTGAGLRIAVNPSSGPAFRRSPLDQLRDELPDADVVELADGDDLVEILRSGHAAAIGAAGGDGTLSGAAGVAADMDVLFVAVPAGTLNHFARDLGLEDVDDAVAAVRAGFAAPVDLGVIGDRTFLNTFSLGGYSAVVDTRERLEGRIGKWPALVVALVRELPGMQPLRLEVDGQPTRVWIGWVGNCVYSPAGLAPSWREAMDDGLLDIRLVTGAKRFSRTRFLLAALTGRLQRCSVYRAWNAASVEVVCLDGPQRLASDGETFDGPARFTVSKRPGALRVALPPPD